MKLLKLLLNQSGKIALTTAQAVTAAAVVGVGGLALMQFSGSSSNDNKDTVFSSQDDAEVVYVAGASGGGYEGVGYGSAYGEGGEVRSGINARMSRDMQLMNFDAQKQPEQEPRSAMERQEGAVQSYALDGQTEGLGMGKNAAKEIGGSMDGDLSALQAQIAQIQANAQKQVSAGAQQAGVESEAAKAAAASFGSGAASGGMARAGGSNLNSTPLQAGQGNGRGGGVLGGARAERANRLTSQHRSVSFEGGRESVIAAGRRFGSVGSLEDTRKVSADVAANANRSANEAVSATFLASGASAGLIRLAGENVSTGGSSSDDYKDISRNMPRLGGIDSEIQAYREAQERLQKKLDDFVKRINTISKVTDALSFGSGILSRWISKLFKSEKTASVVNHAATFLNPVRWVTGVIALISRWVSNIFDNESGDLRKAISSFKDTYGDKYDGAKTFADQVNTVRLTLADFAIATTWGEPQRFYDSYKEKVWSEDKSDAEANANSGKHGAAPTSDALPSAR